MIHLYKYNKKFYMGNTMIIENKIKLVTGVWGANLTALHIAYFKDTFLQIQCHNYIWEYEKVPHVIANILIGDLRGILKCAIFLKENMWHGEINITSFHHLHIWFYCE